MITEKISSKMSKKQRQIGSVNLNSNELPEIKEWGISGTYEITLKVKMKSISEISKWDLDEYSNLSKDDVEARFEILSVKSPKRETAKKEASAYEAGKIKQSVFIK
jgi:hypothetical protein